MSDSEKSADENIIVGKFSGVYGVKGWVKVYSYTEPKEGIAQYNPWYLKKHGIWQEVKIESCKPHAKTVIAKIVGCDDRNEAMLYSGLEISIKPEQLVALGENEFYWRELVGLRVKNTEDYDFGLVTKLMETGSNDVLIVESDSGKETLIPWTMGHAIKQVDLEKGEVLVDWDKDF